MNTCRPIVLSAVILVACVLVGCVRTKSASSFEEALRHQYVAKLDVAKIKEQADNRQPFTLRLGENDVTVQVKPNPVWSADCIEAQGDGSSGQLPCDPGVQTYSGRSLMEGMRTQVRLTIGQDIVSGRVWDGRDWWFIEPLSKFRPEAQPGEHLIYNARDVTRQIPLGDDALPPPEVVQTELLLPPLPPPDGGGGYDPDDDPGDVPPDTPGMPSGPTFSTIGLHLLADAEYAGAATAFGRGTIAEQMALVNNLDGIYRRTLNVTFQVLSSTSDSSASPCLTATTSDLLVDQVMPCFRGLNPGVSLAPNHIVHLTSGKELEPGFLVFGRVRGIAFQPGNAGLSTHRLATVVGGTSDLPDLAFEDLLVVAHEVGHNLDGCHDEADGWCDADFFWICFGPHNTILWPVISGATEARFSTGARTSTHNNRQRILANITNRPAGTIGRTCPS
jgi:hypothetical protein